MLSEENTGANPNEDVIVVAPDEGTNEVAIENPDDGAVSVMTDKDVGDRTPDAMANGNADIVAEHDVVGTARNEAMQLVERELASVRTALAGYAAE